MARFLRSTGHSSLRPPVVVGPANIFRSVAVYTATRDRPVAYDARRVSFSKLRPPTVVAPAPVFVSPPLSVHRTATPARFYKAKSRLQAPVVVAPAIIFQPVAVHRAQTPARFYRPKSKLNAPAVLGTPTTFIASSLEVRYAKQVPRRVQVQYVLRKPTVVAAAVVFRPLKVGIARTPTRYFKAISKYTRAFYIPLEDQGGDLLLPPYDWEIFFEGGSAYRGRRLQLGAYVELWGDTHLQLITRIRAYEAGLAAMGVPVSHQWGQVYSGGKIILRASREENL